MAKRLRSPSPVHGKSRPTVALFVFRRDLRLVDNTALLHLAKETAGLRVPILPTFFFNPAQIEPGNNPYFGKACVRFLMESLDDLKRQLNQNLLLLYGSDESCLDEIADRVQISHLSYNVDYTPFAVARDAALEAWCKKKGIITTVPREPDYTLLDLNGVRNGSDKPYGVFTPYYKKCLASHLAEIRAPRPESDPSLVDLKSRLTGDSSTAVSKLPSSSQAGALLQQYLATSDPAFHPVVVGGREQALVRLHQNVPKMKHYEVERDDIGNQRTSFLSPYLKFGCVSIRETFAVSKQAHGITSCFVRELFWREFYAMLLHHHPSMLCGQVSGDVSKPSNTPFQEKFADFKWKWSEEHWEAFQKGKTGVPLVDAAVRCLNATGWCHNRCRMIIGNFATKVLFVDWRVCERWFATKAVDYDPASNSGGWQWCSGQGADAMPYFRTFNPYTQAKKFDESATFIKKWVPELKDVDSKTIVNWDSKGTLALSKKTGYPLPIVNVRECTKAVIAEYGKY